MKHCKKEKMSFHLQHKRFQLLHLRVTVAFIKYIQRLQNILVNGGCIVYLQANCIINGTHVQFALLLYASHSERFGRINGAVDLFLLLTRFQCRVHRKQCNFTTSIVTDNEE